MKTFSLTILTAVVLLASPALLGAQTLPAPPTSTIPVATGSVTVGQALPVSTVFAQYSAQSETEPGLLTVGLRTGLSFATMAGANVRDSLSPGGAPGYLPGLMLGLNVTTHLQPTFWLQHEVWLQQQGAVIQLIDNSPNRMGQAYRSRLRLTYLTLYPALFTWVRPRVQLYAGPYLGMLLSASQQVRTASGELVTDRNLFGTPDRFDGYASKIDFGAVLGVDLRLTERLTLGVRLHRGIIPIIGENPQTQLAQSGVYNQGLSVNVGYSLSRWLSTGIRQP